MRGGGIRSRDGRKLRREAGSIAGESAIRVGWSVRKRVGLTGWKHSDAVFGLAVTAGACGLVIAAALAAMPIDGVAAVALVGAVMAGAALAGLTHVLDRMGVAFGEGIWVVLVTAGAFALPFIEQMSRHVQVGFFGTLAGLLGTIATMFVYGRYRRREAAHLADQRR